jgi:hypothetical protein
MRWILAFAPESAIPLKRGYAEVVGGWESEKVGECARRAYFTWEKGLPVLYQDSGGRMKLLALEPLKTLENV